MSKKRLYEIAKELGKSSKEVVEYAKLIGLAVKNHASSVEENDAKRIVAKFSDVSQPNQEKSKAEKPKESVVAQQKEVVSPQPTKPQSRNFKAEREARAKAKAKDRRTAQEEQKKTDAQHHNKRQDVTQSSRKQKRNRQNRRDHQNQSSNQKPLMDFKARAVAIKAEQNAEYSRQSEKRIRDRENVKRKTKNNDQKPHTTVKSSVEKKSHSKKSSFVSQPIVTEVSAPVVDRRRKKQVSDKSHDYEHEDDLRKNKNRKNRNNQNSVRNQKNSDWNSSKKNKKNHKSNRNNTPKPVTERKFHELPKEFEYTEGMTVAEIAKRIKREPAEIVKKLFMMSVMATQNQSLDGDTIELLMLDYGIEAHKKVEVDEADIERFFVNEGYLNPENMVERAPVVTIMGHVDHGKTTLLDTLRNSRVATGEAGGITQHIGAYQIVENGKKITFLDTPGHAAFTSMRARGASITDITILIVAADDGVMPQTVEAINHSKAAGVPIIVAINKIDKPGANPERVIGELAEHGIISTAWGGDCEFVEISAKFGKNIEELLETVLLVAEMEELKADPTVRAIGTVIEARLDRGKGAVATLLVQQGTLHVQDPIVVGNTFGRVRAMVNDLGRRVKVADPSTPVSITGLNDVPMAGDHFAVYEDEKAARAAGEERAKRALLKQRQAVQRVNLENLFDTLKAGEVKTVNVIIKADVQGSVEALAASLLKIDVEGVKVSVVHSAVGAINESDVTLAEASNAFIIGFNVRPTTQARQQAETDEVDIRLHSIIYKVIEEVEDAMKGMLDPEYKEKVIGEAIIRETFKVSKVGTIGGFMVTNGKITRDANARVIRDGVVIFDGKLASLKHFKDDVKEIGNGQEGGLMIENYNDIKVDDVIEAYIMEEIKR